MRKKSDKELGVVLPECVVDVIDNRELSEEQIGKIIRSLVWNSIEFNDDIVVRTITSILINTYKGANSARIKKIKASRECKKEYERKRREKANIVEDAILKSVKENMEFHGIVGKVRLGKDSISPYNPPAGDEKTSSAKAHAQTGKRTTGTDKRSPTTGSPGRSPTKGRRTGHGTSVAKGRDGADNGTATTKAGSARPTARKLGDSGDDPERRGQSPKKNAAAAGEELVAAAERMVAKHPNTKSSLRAVVRALRNCDDAAAVEASHAAWCGTDGWAPEKGQYVQSLAAWIANGGWTKPPPEKKPARNKAGRDEGMSFDASL